MDLRLGDVAMYPEDLEHPLSRGDLSLLGIGWREIAGPLWRAPFRGVHVWSGTNAALPRQRALDAAALLPAGGAVGGWAAAYLAGVTELDGMVGETSEPVPLCLRPEQRRRRGTAVAVWRSVLLPEDISRVDGISVTTPVRTGFDIARRSPLYRAVAVLDLLGRGRPDYFESVRAYARDRPRWRGVPTVHQALNLASPLTRSVPETAFRLFWELECRLPTPQVNPLIRRADGRLLGIGDLLDPSSGLLGEYDGRYHRAEEQHALDNAREEAFEDCGLTVVRVGARDLGGSRLRTLYRMRAGLARARRAPRGSWTWEPGPLPPPVPHW
ncbi:MAG TPA: hypothetical protein VFV66_18340 [Nonomuraea sp.]|nr:hypothetical protein [Nonomuraea sp.]